MLTVRTALLLETRRRFTGDELDDFIETVVDHLHRKVIDPSVRTTAQDERTIEVQVEVTIDSEDPDAADGTAFAALWGGLGLAVPFFPRLQKMELTILQAD
jgi:hypothetical protein